MSVFNWPSAGDRGWVVRDDALISVYIRWNYSGESLEALTENEVILRWGRHSMPSNLYMTKAEAFRARAALREGV